MKICGRQARLAARRGHSEAQKQVAAASDPRQRDLEKMLPQDSTASSAPCRVRSSVCQKKVGVVGSTSSKSGSLAQLAMFRENNAV